MCEIDKKEGTGRKEEGQRRTKTRKLWEETPE